MIFDAFQEMANNVKSNYSLGDDEHLRKLNDIPIYYYGLSDKDDVYANDIQITDKGTEFDVYINGKYYDHF